MPTRARTVAILFGAVQSQKGLIHKHLECQHPHGCIGTVCGWKNPSPTPMRINKTKLGANIAPKVRLLHGSKNKYLILTCAHLNLLSQTALPHRRRHRFGSRCRTHANSWKCSKRKVASRNLLTCIASAKAASLIRIMFSHVCRYPSCICRPPDLPRM